MCLNQRWNLIWVKILVYLNIRVAAENFLKQPF